MTVAQIKGRFKRAAAGAVPVGLALALGLGPWAGAARAHASEQGFVLLLPTDIYIRAGGATVALTVLILALMPERAVARLFAPLPLRLPLRLPRRPPLRIAARGGRREGRRRGLRRCGPLVTSLVSAGILGGLIAVGLAGPRDPLSNPLPLAVWTLWWIALVSLQGVLGDLWRWITPFAGPLALIRAAMRALGGGGAAPLRLPRRLGHAPALAGLLGFAGFLMADPAPADPARLARVVALYWLAMSLAGALFGPRWLVRGEALSVLMRAYGRVGLFGRAREPGGARGRAGTGPGVGLWGWQWLGRPVPAPGLALILLAALGCGSFDGLNETFWWLGVLGINPLEFPGRSAVVGANLGGLLAANLLLLAVFAAALRVGLALARAPVRLGRAVCVFAPSVMPIALGYHIAHYLPSFLVDGQYALAALNDPLARGDDLLGLGTFYVTTGFFNTRDTVQAIWLGQAGAVVAGHVLAVGLAQALAQRHLARALAPGRAALLHAPLALFMIGYTIFGLWLLASPRGV